MPDEKRLIGIEIGGTKLQLVLGDHEGGIERRRRWEVDSRQGAAGIRGQIEETLSDWLREGKVDGVGVGFGGPVDWRSGKTKCSHQIGGWEDFELVEWLESVSGVGVAVDNDANVAALGEALCGAGKGADPVFYLTIGSGIGGGLVVGGHIYHGALPGESEVGHLRMDRQGTTLESRCSGWAVDLKIRRLKSAQPGCFLARCTAQEQGGEARSLGEALRLGDPPAREILRETAGDLAFGLSHVTHLFHPERIILGGGLSLLGEPLQRAVMEALSPLVMEAFHPPPQVRTAALGEESVPIGALRLAALRI